MRKNKMKATSIVDLKQQYQSWPNDELVGILSNRNQYREEAISAIIDILGE
jgi:hypothetical protein